LIALGARLPLLGFFFAALCRSARAVVGGCVFCCCYVGVRCASRSFRGCRSFRSHAGVAANTSASVCYAAVNRSFGRNRSRRNVAANVTVSRNVGANRRFNAGYVGSTVYTSILNWSIAVNSRCIYFLACGCSCCRLFFLLFFVVVMVTEEAHTPSFCV
jgi:hypothetical protein